MKRTKKASTTKTKVEKPSEQIKIIVPREERLIAITKLCSAIELTARALSQVPQVTISNCCVTSTEKTPGIEIATMDAVARTHYVGGDE
ncbi:MAG: hypothetical protein PVI43_00680 [Candidatus Bathyarchaeota archaeon]|jgi:hypothetical protein